MTPGAPARVVCCLSPDGVVSGQVLGPSTRSFSGVLRFPADPLQGYRTETEWFLPAWSGWLPLPDGHGLEIEITLPEGLTPMLPGRLVTAGGGRWTWQLPAGTPPTLLLGGWRPAAWSGGLAALYPGAQWLFPLLETVGAAMVRRFGTWPFGALHAAQVTALPVEALSLPGLILLNPGLMAEVSRDPAYAAGLLAHEMAHQWFGNWLHVAPHELWLMESLAECERVEYIRAAVGAEAGDRLLAEGIALYRQVCSRVGAAPVTDLTALRNRDPVAFDGLAYGPGLSLLWAIRSRAGGERFAAALRQLIAERGLLTLAGLCRALRLSAPEMDLLGGKGWHLPHGPDVDHS